MQPEKSKVDKFKEAARAHKVDEGEAARDKRQRKVVKHHTLQEISNFELGNAYIRTCPTALARRLNMALIPTLAILRTCIRKLILNLAGKHLIHVGLQKINTPFVYVMLHRQHNRSKGVTRNFQP